MSEDVANTDVDKKESITKITSYFPLLTIIALGYGVINQLVYYLPFNINILEYTEFDEIILSTLQHLVIFIIPCLIIMILFESLTATFKSGNNCINYFFNRF
jgi:hypothetical protein